MRTVPGILIFAIAGVMACPPALADDKPQELVRLPGAGELKQPALPGGTRDRLVPGGGLLFSFDADGDGRVSVSEIDTGIRSAFANADADGDGVLSAFEQRDWARGLPTRDDTLANPVRFDPNLDRRVSVEEFSDVITALAGDYRAEDSEVIEIAALKAPERAGTPGDVSPRAQGARPAPGDGQRRPGP
jgi:hypothetical protein